MKRTLMQLGIGALEEIFTASKTDAKVLLQLENELQHRQVPRAVALLEQVQLAMKRLATSVLPRAQDELPLEPPAVVAVSTPVARPNPSSVPPQVRPPAVPPVATPVPPTRIERTPISAVSFDDACRLLKVTVGVPWQEVELSRRKLVLLSHPRHVVGMAAERQEAIRDEARRVNAAYAVLSAARAR